MTANPAPSCLALTMGDPAGIGGEITCKAWLRRREGVAPFFLIDDPDRLARLAAQIGLSIPIAPIETPEDAVEHFSDALPVWPMALARPVVPGRPDSANAPAVIAAIDLAVDLARTGRVPAMVTNPISKKVLQSAGFRHPGHTEYLAELTGADRPVMMLACAGLRVVPITVHIPLRAVAAALKGDAIVHAGRVTAAALLRDFGILRPRLAVAALNPHAGEEGVLGSEEKDIIAPAIAELRATGLHIEGPFPADSLFHEARRTLFDAILCMYHDQALIPLKTVDFYGGVNVTLGLPFVRTSPDHGTAFALAGTGQADERSLLAALAMASNMAARRIGATPAHE